MSTVDSKNYNGQDWFWPHDYRHYLRDANARQRKLVHNGWLKIGVPVKKSGLKISDRYLEPKKSQEKKAWTIVKKVITPKELESVNECLNSKGFSIINQSIKTMAINFKDLQKLVKQQGDDGRIWNEVDNIRYDLNRIEKVLKNKTYNESVNEGMTKYNIRLTKTPGWYGIWDKNGKQKAEGEKKYIIKFLKSLKTRMGNFQIKSLVDLAADRKGTNIAFDVAESVNEGSCGYGIDGKVGKKPAGIHLLKKIKKKIEEAGLPEKEAIIQYLQYIKKYKPDLYKGYQKSSKFKKYLKHLESKKEGFADKLTKKMKKHKGTSVKSKKKVKLKGRGVYQQYESDLPITTKKGKTVRAVHKKSGKEIVSVDNPSTRKILKKMGFVVKESVNERMDKRQAGEMLKQLGGNKFIAMTGAKNFAVGPKGASFKIGRNSKGVNYLRIDLKGDLYTMEFIRMRAGKETVLKKVKGVYNDQLQKMFTKYTGMYTSL